MYTYITYITSTDWQKTCFKQTDRQTDRPTDRQTLSCIELLSQLKIKLLDENQDNGSLKSLATSNPPAPFCSGTWLVGWRWASDILKARIDKIGRKKNQSIHYILVHVWLNKTLNSVCRRLWLVFHLQHLWKNT